VNASRLKSELGSLQLFTFGFGTIVGIACQPYPQITEFDRTKSENGKCKKKKTMLLRPRKRPKAATRCNTELRLRAPVRAGIYVLSPRCTIASNLATEARSLSVAVQPDAPTWRLTPGVSNPAQHALTKDVFTRIRVEGLYVHRRGFGN
jgi:hypothetical protein